MINSFNTSFMAPVIELGGFCEFYIMPVNTNFGHFLVIDIQTVIQSGNCSFCVVFSTGKTQEIEK